MPAGIEVLSRLGRTMQSIFRIGSINIKDSSGVVQLRNAADDAYADTAVNKLRVQATNATNAVVLTSPAALGSSVTFTLPGSDGSTGQFLRTNGSGVLSFADGGASAVMIQSEAFTEATSSPLSIFTPPANATIMTVYLVILDAAGSASGVSLNLGVSGDTDAYMQNDEIDVTVEATYIVHPLVNVGGTPDPVILTIVPDVQTFSGAVFVEYVNAL